MKTINDKLSNHKAQKELKRYVIIGPLFSFIGLIVFSWIGIAGVAFSARALLLTKHEGNKNNSKLSTYRMFAIAGTIVGLVDMAALFAR